MIYGTLAQDGLFDAIEEGASLPAGAAEISAADALMMAMDRGHACYKPDSNGGVVLDATAAAAFDLAKAKAVQKALIADSFAADLASGHLVTQGYTMQTDWTDGAKIKASYDMAKTNGALDTDASAVRDIGNVTQACTVADLLSISDQIGGNYLAKLKKKWGLIDQIDAVLVTDTNPVQTVQAVVW